MKPQKFSNQLIVMQDTAYQVLEVDGSVSPLKSGMLSVGRVVWLPRPEDVRNLGEAKVAAYVEPIGLVSVSRNALASDHRAS